MIFISALSSEDKFNLFNDLTPNQRHHVSINFLKNIFGYSKPIYHEDGSVEPGKDLDLSDVPSLTFTSMLNQPGSDYDTMIQYPEGEDVKIIDGKLIIGGSKIDLESLKGSTHQIILNDGKLTIDNKVVHYGSTVYADLDIIILNDGSFEYRAIEAANIQNTLFYPDGTITGDYATALSITNIYLPKGTTQYIGRSASALSGFTILRS